MHFQVFSSQIDFLLRFSSLLFFLTPPNVCDQDVPVPPGHQELPLGEGETGTRGEGLGAEAEELERFLREKCRQICKQGV